MKMNETAFGSELAVEAGKNGNGHSHTHREDSYPATRAAGVTSEQEAAFRLGYQAGFADGFKQTQADTAHTTSAAPRAKNADGRLKRLRGLPCAECGVSMYSDESCCSCCGTPKGARAKDRTEKPS
ncbi:MAG TPA: hypothetical protein VKT71_06810 [Candidatus Acidoferrales bacterium]|nr:hypothetical protein [Candidatus Acidoferrales bacterium]